MRFSIVTLITAASVVQGAVLQARDSGCTVELEPTPNPISGAGEIITWGSIGRWQDATGAKYVDSSWIDYSGSIVPPYSFEYKANSLPGYETNAKIEAVLRNGWIGTYLIIRCSQTFNRIRRLPHY
ncbi:hypothetical protein F5Y14DRAFT_418384 [Nemania sp. NC0429]|nr:hypothetical protein F5Y14DRAFT_418384 [Nemania sp. NC0429]